MRGASAASAAPANRWSKVLKQRLLTAAVLIPLFVWAVLGLPTPYFAVLLALVIVIASMEWGTVARFPTPLRVGFVMAVATLLPLAIWAPPSTPFMYAITGGAVIWWLVSTQWLRRYEAGRPVTYGRWSAVLVGMLVLLPPWLALVALHDDPAAGPAYVLFLFVLIWAADSGAYFCGRRYGRRKLAPRVSPGKTWEGAAGGLAAALAVAVIGVGLLDVSFAAAPAFLILCGMVVVISVVGDLVESLFKREAGVKDSGRFLPGHGGALDRIDSLTAAAPLFYLGVSVIRRLT